MPELPEVEFAATIARRIAGGRTITSVRVLHPSQRRSLPARDAKSLVGDRILDVGCGLADVAIEMAALVQPGGHVLAVDASEEFLDVARHRALYNLGRVDEADAFSARIQARTQDALDLVEPTRLQMRGPRPCARAC